MDDIVFSSTKTRVSPTKIIIILKLYEQLM